jgi:glucosyl-dolichyl phosphate glucuronosyltransferase
MPGHGDCFNRTLMKRAPQQSLDRTTASDVTAADSPVVSVVMSTFNRAALLPGAVGRLMAQRTDVPYEVIVVDNNSTDHTEAVLADLVRHYAPRLKGSSEPRQGVSYGRNKGIELAQGSIIAFTDDDVQVTPEWVAGIAAGLEQYPHVDCVGGRVLPIWTTPRPAWVTKQHWSPLALVDYGDEPLEIDHSRSLCLVTANVAYRRAALDAIGWFSPEFLRCQDHELLLRLWDSGRRGMYLPSLVVTCEVPASRLCWSYHQEWYTTHGRFCAQMREGPAGPHSSPSSGQPLTLFGTPATVYRCLLHSAAQYVMARVTRRDDLARLAEAALRQRRAFVVERAKRWRREHRSIHQELRTFVTGWLNKRLSRQRVTPSS